MADNGRLVMLLGSGISIPAGMPTVDEITERVLSGEGAYRHTDSTYYLGHAPDFMRSPVQRVLGLLKALQLHTESHKTDGWPGALPASYEELAYLATQVSDAETGEVDNPALDAFISRLRPEVQRYLSVGEEEGLNAWELHELGEQATRYVENVEWRLLLKEPKEGEHLRSLLEACADEDYGGTDIFTLNHDTVLESYLSRKGVDFKDGFGQPVNGIRYWQPDGYEVPTPKASIHKLHGSIDWFLFSNHLGIPLHWDIWHQTDPFGRLQHAMGGKPLLLTGTFNKMLAYLKSPFLELHYRFYRALLGTSRLLVCGYGFGDKGINSRIFEWMNASSQHCITVVHADSDQLRSNPRSGFSWRSEEWLKEGRLRIVPKWIEDGTSWADIRPAMD